MKDVAPIELSSMSDSEKAASYSRMSDAEKAQLGTGNYVPYEMWPVFRKLLVDRSLARTSGLDPEMTAYTPGETLSLLENPKIKSWHSKVRSFKVPDDYDLVVLVPCAATKPWADASCGNYKDYNRLVKEYGNVFFVTISEPLGIVPQTMWGDFPLYDNPGLFKDTVMRSGLFTKDYKELFGTDGRWTVPYDQSAYDKAIGVLADVIKGFLSTNSGHDIMSFVESGKGTSTHSDMLSRAGFKGDRFTVRDKPRTGPYEHVKKRIEEKMSMKQVAAGLRRVARAIAAELTGEEMKMLTNHPDFDKMTAWYEERTARHIARVQKWCRRIEDYDSGRFAGLSQRAELHDQSKYEDPERLPYIWITWRYKCERDGVDFEVPEEVQNLLTEATAHHVKVNPHHPEAHTDQEQDLINREDRDKPPEEMIDATGMAAIDLGEMVGDWLAMSEEKDSEPRDWADANVNVRWRFDPWQEDLIYELIEELWENR